MSVPVATDASRSRPAAAVVTRRHAWLRRDDAVGYLLLLPLLLALAAFTIYPLVETIRISFTNSNGVSGRFVGLDNYRYVLTDDVFWQSVYNTAYMGFFTIVVGIPLSLIIASLINSLPAWKSLAKAVYFLPNITSAVAASIAFLYVFYPSDGGWANTALGWMGFGPLRWFADPGLAKDGIVAMSVWHGLGYTTLIWLAGLQTIPRELHEAAATDGAGTLHRFWHVTLPGLRPMTFFIVVIEAINAFKRFADVYQIGGADGQPGGSLTTVMVYIYRTGFNTFDFGKASAASLITFAMVIVLTLVNFRLFRERSG